MIDLATRHALLLEALDAIARRKMTVEMTTAEYWALEAEHSNAMIEIARAAVAKDEDHD